MKYTSHVNQIFILKRARSSPSSKKMQKSKYVNYELDTDCKNSKIGFQADGLWAFRDVRGDRQEPAWAQYKQMLPGNPMSYQNRVIRLMGLQS